MAQTTTRAQVATAAATTTYERILYVTRKLRADLLNVIFTYGVLSEAFAQETLEDLRILLDEDVLSEVEFVWYRPGSDAALHAIRYAVHAEGATQDDRSGGLRYDPALKGAQFQVRIHYNARWNTMSEGERKRVRGRLHGQWSPAQRLSYTHGQWSSDRGYALDGYGLERRRFQ